MSRKERKGKEFLKCKEPKNVEHCFGVLQKARFAIIHNLSRQWDMATIEKYSHRVCDFAQFKS
jgi:hypothetical protein